MATKSKDISYNYAYLRVSTSAQDVEAQKYGILQYANRENINSLKFYEDSISGLVHWRDRELGNLLEIAPPGSVILFSEVSRIGRTILQVLEFLHLATEKNISVHIAKENLKVNKSLQSRITLVVLALAAEIERALISSRTIEALADKKAKGFKLGRPPGKASSLKLDEFEKEILAYLEKDITISNIAKLIGCHRNTLSNWLEVRGHRRKNFSSGGNNHHAA